MVWATDVSNNLFGNGSQSGYVEKLSDVGPNGGKVFRVVISAIMPSGSVRSRFLYSTGMNVNTESVIIHSAQYETAIETATGYQQTFGGYDVYEPGYNQVYWLDYDVVDDVLVSTNPDLGTNVTRARATIGGAVIEQGVTLSANLNHISKAFLALGCIALGSFPIHSRLCTQQRCWSVSGQSLATAFQNPSAPSPTANLGAFLRPRCFKSINTSSQLAPIHDSHQIMPITLMSCFIRVIRVIRVINRPSPEGISDRPCAHCCRRRQTPDVDIALVTQVASTPIIIIPFPTLL